MLNSKIVKISLLSIAFVAVSFIISVATSATSVNAMAAVHCYDYERWSIGSCGCHSYVCYSGDVTWDGGVLPSGGNAFRAGTWCTNGYGSDFESGNQWGTYGGGCF